jgi:hypothetical protein
VFKNLLFLVKEIKQLDVENPLAEDSITSISIIRDNTGHRSGLYLIEIPNLWIFRYSNDFSNIDVMHLIHSANMKSLLRFETSATPSVQLIISGKTLPLVRKQYSVLFWLYVPNHDSEFRGILNWGRAPGLWVKEDTLKLYFRISPARLGCRIGLCWSSTERMEPSQRAQVGLQFISMDNVHVIFALMKRSFRTKKTLCLFVLPLVLIVEDDDSRCKLDKIVFSNHPLSQEAIAAWY